MTDAERIARLQAAIELALALIAEGGRLTKVVRILATPLEKTDAS